MPQFGEEYRRTHRSRFTSLADRGAVSPQRVANSRVQLEREGSTATAVACDAAFGQSQDLPEERRGTASSLITQLQAVRTQRRWRNKPGVRSQFSAPRSWPPISGLFNNLPISTSPTACEDVWHTAKPGGFSAGLHLWVRHNRSTRRITLWTMCSISSARSLRRRNGMQMAANAQAEVCDE